MTISYNLGIPAANNNPSNDQPDMLVNTQSVSDIWAVDHVTFSGNPAGTHAQVTFSSKNTPGAQTDPESVLYTASGTASTNAALRFVNQSGTFPINCLRAFALVTGVSVNGAAPLANSFNVTSATRTNTGVYDIILPANVVTGTSFGILATAFFEGAGTSTTSAAYSITGAGTFTLLFKSSTANFDPTNFTFTVYQI